MILDLLTIITKLNKSIKINIYIKSYGKYMFIYKPTIIILTLFMFKKKSFVIFLPNFCNRGKSFDTGCTLDEAKYNWIIQIFWI